MPRADPPCRAAALLLCAAFAGCAAPPLPSQSRNPPPAPVNLSGFPPAFRDGHADGCASAGAAPRRDEARYRSDALYAQGWRDGHAACGRRR